MKAALLMATLAFAPQTAIAQGGPPGGGGNVYERVGALEEGLDRETNERQDADDQEATDRATADNALQSSLNQETAARSAGDVNLQTNLDQEIANRTMGDNALQSALDQETSNLQAFIDAEEAARFRADNVLTTNLDQETAARQASIDAEESARFSADNVLTTNLAALTDVLCQAIQKMAGNPSPEAIALCGDQLFKTVFLTSTVHNGDFTTGGGAATGLAGADNICNARATTAGLYGMAIGFYGVRSTSCYSVGRAVPANG